MKHILLIAVIILVVLTGCRRHKKPAPPCDRLAGGIARNCLSVIPNGSQCCNITPSHTTGYKYVLSSAATTRKIIAVLQREKLTETGIWEPAPEVPLIRMIDPRGSFELPECNGLQIQNTGSHAKCILYSRYSVIGACFSDECETPVNLPQNTDTPKIDCFESYNTNSSHCYRIDTRKLDGSIRSGLSELTHRLYQAKPDTGRIPLSAEFMALLSFGSDPKDSTFCNDRVSEIVGLNFVSTGSSCTATPVLDKPIPFFETGKTYQNLWVEYPNILDGKIVLENGGKKRTLRYLTNQNMNNMNLIHITVELELDGKPTGEYRSDVITAIYITTDTKGYGSLILNGKDFICISFDNISYNR